jgi:hypothetical protein
MHLVQTFDTNSVALYQQRCCAPRTIDGGTKCLSCRRLDVVRVLYALRAVIVLRSAEAQPVTLPKPPRLVVLSLGEKKFVVLSPSLSLSLPLSPSLSLSLPLSGPMTCPGATFLLGGEWVKNLFLGRVSLSLFLSLFISPYNTKQYNPLQH